jgi:hypothetical protein
MKSKSAEKKQTYNRIIEAVFKSQRIAGSNRFSFSRDDLLAAATELGLEIKGDETVVARNIGDIIYTYRFRKDFPHSILKTAPEGEMWIILGKGIGAYEFRLITIPGLSADPNWQITKLHDATPEIVRRFKLNDEQAVLARIRYNRLVDLFCRCIAYSLQNHLRTNVQGIGQIEIDELYVGANRQGEHYIIPVQVKRERDRLGVSQLLQDLEYCARMHPEMEARAIGAQMMRYKEDGGDYDRIVLFEFKCQDLDDDVRISKVAERHFVLLPHTKITKDDLEFAKKLSEEDLSGN